MVSAKTPVKYPKILPMRAERNKRTVGGRRGEVVWLVGNDFGDCKVISQYVDWGGFCANTYLC